MDALDGSVKLDCLSAFSGFVILIFEYVSLDIYFLILAHVELGELERRPWVDHHWLLLCCQVKLIPLLHFDYCTIL